MRDLALQLVARHLPRWALRHLAPSAPAYAQAGERLAELALRRLGWRLLGRRVRTPWAEIDLLLAAHGTLVVVEVKTGRCGPRFRPGMRLGRAALARLVLAGRALARGAPSRVDLVEVLLDGHGRAEVVHHEDLREPL